MKAIPPLFPHFSNSFSSKEKDENLYFLNSGRSALELIIKDLQEKYSNLLFLIPSYTCPSVLFALISCEEEFDFVDLDETLDLKLEDLQGLIEKYSERKIVLLPTSLFSINIRDYTSMFEEVVVVEDRAQSLIEPDSKADYQFVSFGKGKLVSAFNGGAVYTRSDSFKTLYEKQLTAHGFLTSVCLVNLQSFVTKYFYRLIEKSSLNPEIEEEVVFHEDNVLKISQSKVNWILNSIATLDLSRREESSKRYLELIDKKYQFSISSNYFLRFPVKKRVEFSGVSSIYDYRYTYETAKEKRKVELTVAKDLAYNCSFLPTHDLVDEKYIEKVVQLINE